MACTFLRVGFLAFMVVDDAAILKRKLVNFAQDLRIVVAKSRLTSLTRIVIVNNQLPPGICVRHGHSGKRF
jgi:hypothetical protein